MTNTMEKQFYKNVGKKLKSARKEAGFTQQQVADRIGLTRVSITNLEAGRHAPSLWLLHKMRCMGINLWYEFDDRHFVKLPNGLTTRGMK